MAEPSQQASSSQETAIDQSMHALPTWFAWFQRTFGLSFLVLCSAYLMGKLATIGWVQDLYNPMGWGWFNGAGVVFFFFGGVAISGIALTCSLTFAQTIMHRPFTVGHFITAVFTLVGMLVFFGIEVFASMAERSVNIVATRLDQWIWQLFAVSVPLTPTMIVVSLMFPLGSMYFGFVQQGRQRLTQADVAEDKLTMEQRIQHERLTAELAEVQGKTAAARAGGVGAMARAGLQGLRGGNTPETPAEPMVPPAPVTDLAASGNGHAPISQVPPADFP